MSDIGKSSKTYWSFLKRLTFNEYLKNVSNKISKAIGLLRKLEDILPRLPFNEARPALLTIYKELQYLTYIIKTKSISGNSGMVHFAEINQRPSPYSMLQHIDRVAIPKLVPRNCPRYLLANNIDNEGRRIGLRIHVRYCRFRVSSFRVVIGNYVAFVKFSINKLLII